MADLARQAAYDALYLVDQDRRRRRLKLDDLMNRIRYQYAEKYADKWGRQEQTLFHALCTGVVRHWWQLEGLLIHFLKRDLRHVTPQVRSLIRLGLFQMLHLTEIPEYAAVHATVQVAQHRKLSKKTVGLINGVLRTAGRQKAAGELPHTDLSDDPYGYLIGEGALPNWLARHLLDFYSPEVVAEVCRAQQTPVPITLRVNTLKASVDDVKQSLIDAELSFKSVEGLDDVIRLDGFVGSPAKLPGFEEGHIYVQDVSSSRVAPFVLVSLDENIADLTIIDACAAPGSKTTHLAARMKNTGQIIAIDRSSKRLADVADNLERLGVDNVRVIEGDSQRLTFDQLELPALANAVLVDAPCSGLGTLRKHPEILLNLREKDMATFPPAQLALLQNTAQWVKAGGVLVYSTCSISPTENEQIVTEFLANNHDFTLDEQMTYMTHADEVSHWDGFYMARLVKRVV